jgi:hypothetical protein
MCMVLHYERDDGMFIYSECERGVGGLLLLKRVCWYIHCVLYCNGQRKYTLLILTVCLPYDVFQPSFSFSLPNPFSNRHPSFVTNHTFSQSSPLIQILPPPLSNPNQKRQQRRNTYKESYLPRRLATYSTGPARRLEHAVEQVCVHTLVLTCKRAGLHALCV